MFTSTKDMLTFLEAIVTYDLLSPAETREWMKPQAHTSQLSLSVGLSWEILRSKTLTSDGRVVDVYTKGGALGLYQSLVGIVPGYDIVFSVMSGGSEAAQNLFGGQQLTSFVLQALIPAIEEAGKREASENSVGTYFDEETNSTLKIEIDDGPGLHVTEFNVRGADVLSNLVGYTLAGVATDIGPPGGGDMYSETRLHPTERVNDRGSLGNGTTDTAWIAHFDVIPPDVAELIESTLFFEDGTCNAWNSFDLSAYNYHSIGEFILTSDKDGATTQISSEAFDVTLKKKQDA